MLPKVVKRRVHALKRLQVQCANIEAKFYEEVHELERKYAALYHPLFEKVLYMLFFIVIFRKDFSFAFCGVHPNLLLLYEANSTRWRKWTHSKCFCMHLKTICLDYCTNWWLSLPLWPDLRSAGMHRCAILKTAWTRSQLLFCQSRLFPERVTRTQPFLVSVKIDSCNPSAPVYVCMCTSVSRLFQWCPFHCAHWKLFNLSW